MKLMTFKYKDRSSIVYHLYDFQGILDQLSGMGVNFNDEIQGLDFIILYQILGNSFCFFKKFYHWWKGDYVICKKLCVE